MHGMGMDSQAAGTKTNTYIPRHRCVLCDGLESQVLGSLLGILLQQQRNTCVMGATHSPLRSRIVICHALRMQVCLMTPLIVSLNTTDILHVDPC
jgi:hypothetical protein